MKCSNTLKIHQTEHSVHLYDQNLNILLKLLNQLDISLQLLAPKLSDLSAGCKFFLILVTFLLK